MLSNPNALGQVESGELNTFLDKFVDTTNLALVWMQYYRSRAGFAVSADDPFVITFVGRFKTGKSSLINALIGYDILPTRAITATAVVTRIARGKTKKAWLLEKNTKHEITVPQAQEIILNYKIKDGEEPPEILFELPISWLPEDVVLVDTPGMDDSAQNGALEEVTMDTIDNTDFCVCVYDADAFLSEKERPRTKKIHEQLGGNVIYAVNCVNKLNSPENWRLVEEQAAMFFSSMQYPSEEMGRFFMTCSAPGNIYLNGFDTVFQKLVGAQNAKQKAEIRSSSAKGQMRLCGREAIAVLEADLPTLQAWESDLEKRRNAEQQKRKKQIIDRAKKKANHLRYQAAPDAVALMTDISGLEEELTNVYKDTEKMEEYSEFSNMCKAISKSFFRKRFNAVHLEYPEHYPNNFSKIESALSRLTFPDKHSVDVQATNGERLGGAAVGAGIGLIFGPVGAFIGGIIGGFVGNLGTTQDDSIENTMVFVKNTVVPLVRQEMEEFSRSIANRYITEAERSAEDFSFPMDSELERIRTAKREYQKKKKRIESMMQCTNM